MEDWSRGLRLVETCRYVQKCSGPSRERRCGRYVHGLDSEEITEELKQRLKCQVELEKKHMYKPGLGKSAVGKTLYPCLRCRVTSVYEKVSGIWYGLEFVLVLTRAMRTNTVRKSKHRWKGKFMEDIICSEFSIWIW